MSSASAVPLAKVVEELCKHGIVIDGKTQLSHGLDTPIAKRKQWEDLYNKTTSTYGVYDHFTNLLEEWIIRRGSQATMGELKRILRNFDFIAAEESLESLGDNDSIIKINLGTSSIAPNLTRFGITRSKTIFVIFSSLVAVTGFLVIVFDSNASSDTNATIENDQPKPTYYGVTSPTPFFVGREDEVHKLSELFLNRSSPVVVISGIGGQGKTELCRQFIKTLKDLNSPASVIWLSGDGASVLNSDITELAQYLQIPVIVDGRSVPFDKILFQISIHMPTSSPKGWIVIIDNVDEMYAEFRQTISALARASAFVIVTSRRIDILSGESMQMKLEVLKAEDAEILLTKNLNHPPEEEVKDLCRELGNHVLAIRQAIAYIAAQQHENTRSYGIKNYLDDLAKDKTLLKNQVNFIDGYDQTIFIVVTRTLQTIIDNYGQHGKLASEIMEVLSLVRPEISISSLQKITEAAKIFNVENSANNEELHQVLLLLKKYSLIFYDDQTSLSIHRLIQKVAKKNNSICVKTILKNLIVEVASIEELRQLISIWDHADQDVVKEYSNFPIGVFYKMYHLSMILELKSFAKKNHQLLHKLLGPDHKDTLRMEGCVGIALEKTGNYDEALIRLKETLRKNKQVFGEDHPETLGILSHIAIVFGRLNRYEESFECFESLLQSLIRLHGSEHEDTMRARHNKALVLDDCGRVDEALSLYQEVLEWESKNLGDSHRSTLVTRFNMATILYDKCQFEDAKTEFEILLSLNEKTLGNEHVDIIDSKYCLAWAFWWLERKDEAMTMMTEVLELREKVLGTNHPNTQHSRDTISQWKTILNVNFFGFKF